MSCSRPKIATEASNAEKTNGLDRTRRRIRRADPAPSYSSPSAAPLERGGAGAHVQRTYLDLQLFATAEQGSRFQAEES